MEKISDFFKEIMDRLRNPLISSFVLAWLIVNWKIVVGLFWYNTSQLKGDGYVSYFDLIEKNNTARRFLFEPLLFSVLYTCLFPIIRTLITALNARIDKWGTNWYLKISREGQIPVTKYIQMSDQLKERIAQVQKLINIENEISAENSRLLMTISEQTAKENDLAKKIAELWDKLTEKQSQADDLRIKNSIQFFDGNWSLTYSTQSVSDVKRDITILHGEATFITGGTVFFRITRSSFSQITNEFTIFVEFLAELPDYREWQVLVSRISDNSILVNSNHTHLREFRRLAS